ncbi:MAG: preprotein translocase subunit SecG [Planctomycetota bacterium]|nr:preprotein translocase subunit SecG [Planctomycetota bacterium]
MVLIIPVLWLLFGLSALLLIVVVLLQEPKGGGLAEAFGGMGAQTFGVKSGGINRFTFIVFTVFILSATLIHVLRKTGG